VIRFLETGDVPEGLFRPDVFLDLTMPTWRVQAASAEALIAERKQGHPGPGTVTRWRADPTPDGFVFEFEERWHSEGQPWYGREMMAAPTPAAASPRMVALSWDLNAIWCRSCGRPSRFSIEWTSRICA